MVDTKNGSCTCLTPFHYATKKSGVGVVCGWQKRGAPRVWGPSFGSGWRRCPTLPHPGECSTIGVSRLSFRVRYGSGRFPGAMTTATIIGLLSCSAGNTRGFPGLVLGNRRVDARDSVYSTWVLALSEAGERRLCLWVRLVTSQLQELLLFHVWSINPVVFRGPSQQIVE